MPTSYTIALFLHICGAFGFAISICASFFGLLSWRRSRDVGQILSIGKLLAALDPLAIIGGLVVLFSGLFMANQGFTFTTGWIDVALGSFIALGAVNGALVQRQRRAIMTLAGQATTGPVPVTVAQRIQQPLLGIGLAVQLWLLVAIIFLMTVQPDLAPSLITVGVALVAGIATGLLWRMPATDASRVAASTR